MFRQDCPKRVGFTILFPHNTVAFKHGFSHMNLPRAKRLKSDGHPVHPESARAAVLASLADVDRVVIFLENTPVKLIDAIRPEVLVKGADYTRHTVVAGDIVERYGGRVLLADLIPGYSTTATIQASQRRWKCTLGHDRARYHVERRKFVFPYVNL